MKLNRIAAAASVLALSVAPGMALANSGNGHGGTNTPGPNASLPAKAKAYGKFCRGESKKHVAGKPGTPFSLCVSGGAQLLQEKH